MSFPLTEPNRTSKGGLDFLYNHLSFAVAYSLKSEKIGLLILLNCEASRPTVCNQCPDEQQTSDNLIVKDNCFITEMFDKCSFIGILRECLSYVNEAKKE